jgi:8-oxo-dGTP diphosphatase
MQAADDAASAKWFPVSDLPPLAFDHKRVVRECFMKACQMPEAASIEEKLRVGVDGLAGDWRQ